MKILKQQDALTMKNLSHSKSKKSIVPSIRGPNSKTQTLSTIDTETEPTVKENLKEKYKRLKDRHSKLKAKYKRLKEGRGND